MRANLIAVVIAMMLVAPMVASCCGHIPIGEPRSPSVQDDAVALVEQACVVPMGSTPVFTGASGSAVVLDARHLLTAAHMADCSIQAIRVTLADTTQHLVAVTWRDVARDLAVLEVIDSRDTLGDVARPRFGAAHAGMFACSRVAYPHRETHCGTVSGVDPTRVGYDVWFSGLVEHGNSGAGVYDPAGNLIGIVTRTENDAGGLFTSVLPTQGEMR